MRSYNRIPIFVCMMVMLFACATMNVNLTPKQAAAWMNNIYSAQYDEYLTWFDAKATGLGDSKMIYTLKPNVPEKQIQILKVKKEIFIELEPLLKEYSAYAASGQKTPLIDQVSQKAIALVQRLIDMEGGTE